MAKRLNPQQDERARSAIKTSQLINRLNSFALEELGPNGERVEIDPPRLKAIEILLRKTLPDLKAVEHSGEVAAQVIRRTIYEAKPDNP